MTQLGARSPPAPGLSSLGKQEMRDLGQPEGRVRAFRAVFAFPSRPWDPELPDDVEEMKLILHMWVALFYSKPSKVLSSRRKVVEHSNPKKFVSLNSTGDFLELSDDGEESFGPETCPADSRSEPDQTPSSSPDPSTRCRGPFRPGESPADSQTDAVDSRVSSSSGELPPGEEEPSSTSSESPSLAERAARSNLAEKFGQLDLPEEEHACDVSTAAAVRARGGRTHNPFGACRSGFL